MSTGNEIEDPYQASVGDDLDHAVFDSNRPALFSLFASLGAKALDVGIVEDEYDKSARCYKFIFECVHRAAISVPTRFSAFFLSSGFP
jgi:molybdopterin biosynthesis enzyme